LRYNFAMPRTAQQILDDALQLSPAERHWMAEQLLIELNEEAFSVLEAEYGKPEPGYDEWFRSHIEEALADTSPGVPHEQVMTEVDRMIRRAKERKLKETA
jgi:hypothetical protein